MTAWIEEKQTTGVFLIHKDDPGLSIKETWDMMAMRATGSHDLVLNEVMLDEEKLVELLQGPRELSRMAGRFIFRRFILALLKQTRDYAVQFASEYSPNSLKGPIKDVPAVQQRTGEMELELLNARHFLFHIAQLYDNPERRPHLKSELGAAKHIVTNACAVCCR